MRALTYWCAAVLDGENAAYNIRAKTRRECKRLVEKNGREAYGKPTKVVIAYHDLFDLMVVCCGEGGNYHEPDE